ncbi:MAG: questin oxidase family protein [Pseudomonadota bacterium]
MLTSVLADSTESRLTAIMDEMPLYRSEFTGTFANHAPMVLVALAAMGGSKARLRDFFDRYNADHALLPPTEHVGLITHENLDEFLGERERESDYARFFEGEVDRLGIEGALAAYLPRFSDGVAASALHGLMRAAYAVLRADRTETVHALAYWAATYLPLAPSKGAAPVTDDPAEVLKRVAALPALRSQPIQEMLWHNMLAVSQEPSFAPVVDWLALGPDADARLASASLALFTATQDFCALHALTGAHWVRIVAPYTPQPDLLRRHFWQAVAALMPKMEFPAVPPAETLEEWRRLPMPDWPEITAAACQSYDEHDISVVFSAREQHSVYGDPLHKLAAARRMGLVADYTVHGMAPA